MNKDGHKRFLPDLTEWKQTLLSFDFFKDITDARDKETKFEVLPENFTDANHYIKLFTPLYWEEVKANLGKAKLTEMSKETERAQLQKFRLEPPFIKLELLRSKEDACVSFYYVADIVLLSQSADPRDETANHVLALVDGSIGNVLSVTVVQGESPRMLQMANHIANRDPWHIAKVMATTTLSREYEGLVSLPHIPLCDIIVNYDEGVKLDTGIEMQASEKQKEARKEEVNEFTIPAELKAKLHSAHNESQMKAIMDSAKIGGITLVQGPPGTGKTKTILGILAVLLNARAKKSEAISYNRLARKRKREAAADGKSDDSSDADMSEGARAKVQAEIAQKSKERLLRMKGVMPWLQGGFVPWNARWDADNALGPGDTVPYFKMKPNQLVKMSEVSSDVAPKKLLVCAPSNAAVDEVLRRVDNDGVMNEEGVSKKRSLTRLGPNVHSSLNAHALETMIKRRIMSRGRARDMAAQEAEREKILWEAQILFATLSISGSRDVINFPGDFDTVVVDEASQGLEVSMLTPLKLGCKRLILVGDPKQLPATCFSDVAKRHKYERSLFERLEESMHKVNMLQTQYRMHPTISYFPSQRFYQGKVLDALEADPFEKKFPAPWANIPCFKPVVFFDLKGTQSKSYISWVNDEEADFVIQLYHVLHAMYPNEVWRERLAVISPYAEQVSLIRKKFRDLYSLGKKDPCPVDVNTVDGFQGREKDVIVVSVVRADATTNSIGFVRDRRRMNVAFTRARKSLWVVGHAHVLGKNEDWRAFVDQQREKCRLLRTSKPYKGWLRRYLRGWYDRNPDVERPGEEVLGNPADDPEEEKEPEKAGGFTVTAEELKEIELRDKEEARQARPDVEEVSDDEDFASVSDFDEAPSDAEGAKKAEKEKELVTEEGGGTGGDGKGED